jgi:hypothetical protein
MGWWKELWSEGPSRVQCTEKKVEVIQKELDGTIGEPVQSIIRTLKNGEWSFEARSGVYLYFTHEWFGNRFWVHRSGCTPQRYFDCSEAWMNKAEKDAVAEVCFQIVDGVVFKEKQESIAKQREKFMVLTGEC